MSPRGAPVATAEDNAPLPTVLVAAVLLFAPLIKGGNVPIPLLIMQVLALLMLARLVFVPACRQHLPGWGMLVLALAVLLPLLYLISVPLGLWGGLPGRGQYLEMLQFSRDLSASLPARALSLRPFDSEAGWYALLVPVAVFLITVGLPDRRLSLLVKIFLGMALFQALLGLLQFIQGPESALRLGNPYYLESAVGSYVNRNHLAGLLVMALPLAIALAVGPLTEVAKTASQKSRSLAELPRPLLVGLLIIVLLVGLVFTRSRAGIGLGLLGVLLSAMVFSVALRSRRLLLMVAVVLLVGLAVVATIGLEPIIARYASPDTIDNERWRIFSAAWQAAQQFSPIGSGPATFPQVFPLFQPGDMTGFVNRVHNDYLEIYFDGGLVLLIPVLLLLLMYAGRWKAFLRRDDWGRFELLQVSAGISVLLLLLHSLVDFNLHIPANAAYFAFLAGVFFHHSQSRKRSRSSPRASTGADPKTKPAPARVIPDENQINPFEDDGVSVDGAR